MRVFYLRFTKDDFITTLPNQWQTALIDLYSNESYQNYSTVKSYYGLPQSSTDWNSNKKYVWTGLTGLDGILDDGRYIDCTGPINIIGYSVITSFPYTGNTTVDLSLTSNNNDYSDEWIQNTGYTQVGGINQFGANRYAQFNLNFDVYPGTDAIFYVRIEIGPPVIAPKYSVTQEVLHNFPQWMAMREYDQEVLPATPQLAVPTSLGGAVINAVSGEWLEDLRFRIRDGSSDMYIDTVNVDQIAWCYKTLNVPQYLYSIVGDGISIGKAYDLGEFYEADSDEYVAYWDEDNQILYCNQVFDVLLIDGVQYPQAVSQVWNAIDELGLLVDLPRLSLESNTSYQSRIYDVFKNPLGAGSDNFKLALRRELNMWSLYGSTPDSDYLGATPDVLEISDIEVDSTFIYPNGLPKERFLTLVDQLAVNYPSTWGYFRWDKMLWDMGGTNYEGYNLLPQKYDATPLDDSDTQSGVGDGDDLLIFRPDEITGPHDFEAEFVLRGKQAISQTQYPPLDLTVEIQGVGQRVNYQNPATTVWFTVELLLISDDATPSTGTYFYSFQLSSTSDVDLFQMTPSAASYAAIELIGSNGFVNPTFAFANKLVNESGGLDVLGELVESSTIDTLTIQLGKWDISAGAYTNFPGSDIFTAWLSTDSSTVMSYDSDPLEVSNNLMAPAELPRVSLIMSSNQTTNSDDSGLISDIWYSETITVPLTINSDPDITSPSPTTISIPTINWDPYVTGDQYYTITVISNNGAVIPEYGGLVRPLNGNPYFIDTSYVFLNGSNTWNNNQQTLAVGSVSSFVFSAGSGSLYPVTDNLWEPYTSDTYSITGTVDENGPWVNGYAPPLGTGNSDTWTTLSLTRSDFNVPNSSNYIINWIGVSTNDSQVVAWLDSNSIIPSIPDGSATYPSNAVIEEQVASKYIFSSFPVYVRLAPGGAPQWYPQINAGTFFEGQQEYYLYANPLEETATANFTTLDNVARQGAPIIIKTSNATPAYLRQVAFFDNSSTPDFNNPTQLSIYNSEQVFGTDTYMLYSSYPGINSISVTDITIPTEPIGIPIYDTSIGDSTIFTQVKTYADHIYELTYKVTDSFYVDNSYVDDFGKQHTYINFDATPASPDHYIIDYEGSALNNATPISVPLSPLYTSVDQGFLFISHEEYPLGGVTVDINPTKIVANGRDYLLITVRSYDTYDNPKPNQNFTISTTYGILSTNSIHTDKDGYASLLLIGTTNTPSMNIDPITLLPQGTITIVGGGVTNSIDFLIEAPMATPNSIYAVASQDQIPADGISQNVIYGKVFDSSSNPVPYAYVEWTKARSNYELFASPIATTGEVMADGSGTFIIGPFSSQPPSGYWFLSTETSSASPNLSFDEIGDVVYWYEYSPSIYGVNNMNGLPPAPIQAATPIGAIPAYSYGNFYPVNYSEEVPPPIEPIATPSFAPMPFTPTQDQLPYPPPYVNPIAAVPVLNWLPPQWYPLPKYTQYQLGLIYIDDEHDVGGEI